MKNFIILLIAGLLVANKVRAAYLPFVPIKSYNNSGAISITKRWMAEITPSTGNGYSVDITSAGFTNVMAVNAIAVKNTSTTTSVPNVAIKTITTSAIVINIIEGNASLVTILGSAVPLGVSQQFANTSGLTVWMVVEGN